MWTFKFKDYSVIFSDEICSQVCTEPITVSFLPVPLLLLLLLLLLFVVYVCVCVVLTNISVVTMDKGTSPGRKASMSARHRSARLGTGEDFIGNT